MSSDLVAIVDLGSAAVRFLLAQIRPRAGFRILAQERVPTRLGGGAPGTLPRRAIDLTLRAVHRFFTRHSPQDQGPRIVAIATSAVRDARNRERLLDPLRRNEGIEVRVLSAREEARFGVAAALDSLPFAKGLVADLGGASLQLSRVRHRRVVSTASLPLGAVLGVTLRGMPDDVYFKVGLIAIVGLSAKNAILIIEFAKDLQAQGRSVREAILEAVQLRFRPILMTSMAFILGVMPLAFASGAGSASQRAIGTGVMGGMITATALAVFLVPVFFVVVRRYFPGSERQRKLHAHEFDKDDTTS